MPRLNKQTKQKYKPNHQQVELPPHSALPIRGKTNKQNLSTKLTLRLTQPTGPTLGGPKLKRRKNSALKPGKRRPQTQQVMKKMMKRQRNITQMKEQTRNTEVQINEEEIEKFFFLKKNSE